AEIALDPLTFIPGGAIAKGIKATTRPVARGFANVYKRVEPQAVRNVREQTVQPALERTKDALGRAFVPDYKLGEDLYGRADDTILRAKQDAENTMRFMNENVMRNIADEA